MQYPRQTQNQGQALRTGQAQDRGTDAIPETNTRLQCDLGQTRGPGQRQDPGKVFKGKKMAGHMGDKFRTMLNLEVIKSDPNNDLLYNLWFHMHPSMNAFNGLLCHCDGMVENGRNSFNAGWHSPSTRL